MSRVIPPGKQVNGFTGEIEDAAPLVIAPSPADQRILAAPPHTEPLAVNAERAVNARGDAPGVDVATHVGPSLTEDPLPGKTPLAVAAVHDTPHKDISGHLQDNAPTSAAEVPPNDAALDDSSVKTLVATEGDDSGYVGLDTTAYNESLERRAEAKANRDELPPVEPAVPVPNGESAPATKTSKKSKAKDEGKSPSKARTSEQ